MEKKLDGNYARMLRAILNRSWRQHPTKQQRHGHLPPITKTIRVRRTRHVGHCWRSRDELLWTSSQGRATGGRPARTYIQQLCVNTGCSLEDLLGAMDDKDGWRKRESQGDACWQHDMVVMITSSISSWPARNERVLQAHLNIQYLNLIFRLRLLV